MSHGASCAVDDMKKMEVLTILRSESSRVGVGGIMTTRHLAARNEPEREVRSCMDAAQRGANVHARDKTRLKVCQTPFDVASTKEVMELLREHELSEPKNISLYRITTTTLRYIYQQTKGNLQLHSCCSDGAIVHSRNKLGRTRVLLNSSQLIKLKSREVFIHFPDASLRPRCFTLSRSSIDAPLSVNELIFTTTFGRSASAAH